MEEDSDSSGFPEEGELEQKEEAAAQALPLVSPAPSPSASLPTAIPSASSSSSSPTVSRPAVKLSPGDFLPSALLGEGSYSQVYLVESRSAPPVRYAMKVLNKAHLQRYARSHMAIAEKAALSRCAHPNIVRLFHTFQDAQSLYFILELCEGGDVFALIEELGGGLPLDVVRFYAAQLLCALHYLHHSARILHRDIKPENLMLAADRQLKLADFGTAKLLDDPQSPQQSPLPSSALSPSSSSPVPKKRSFVGTAAYVAPEILSDGEVGYGVDQWSAGCSLYQMLTGTTPFTAPSEYLTFQRILHSELRMQPGMDPDACDLIRRLMDRNPSARLGCAEGDWQAVESHPFFLGVDWSRIKDGSAQCPALPSPVKGKKFSLVSEESLMGWTRKGAEGEERKQRPDEDGEWSTERSDGGGGGGDERRRGETLDSSEGSAATSRVMGGHRKSQLSVHREGRESDSGGVEDIHVDVRGTTAASHSSDLLQAPPRATQTSTSTSTSTGSTASTSTSTSASAPLLRPSALHPGESIILSSFIRPVTAAATTSGSSSPLSFCLPFCCFASSSSSSSPSSLLLTSHDRILLVEEGKGGEVSREWQLRKWKEGRQDQAVRVEARAQSLRLTEPVPANEAWEWEVVSGSTPTVWAETVEAMQAERA